MDSEPSCHQITPNVKMYLSNMEKFDEGWESLGLETIRQFCYYMWIPHCNITLNFCISDKTLILISGEANGCSERLFRIHEDAFNVPDQDLDKLTNGLGQLGLNEVPQDFAKVFQDYRKY